MGIINLFLLTHTKLMADILNSLGLGGMDLGGIDIGALASGDLSGLDMGSIMGGLMGNSAPSHNCPPGDQQCIDDFNEAAAAAALKKRNEEDEKFKEEYENMPVSSTGLECSMDGFTDMALKLVENLLLIVSLLKETLA